jgi:hypothetical protein
MVNITIKYGTGNTLTKSFTTPVTISQVLQDPSVKGALGYGSNVEGHLLGVPQDGGITLRSGDVLSVHDKASTKA